MTDTFNLVPGTNEEKFLDNILRTAQGEQPQYNLAPNWRIEQYLDAIQKAIAQSGGGGGALPPITDADNGKVLTANSGVWGAQEPIGKKFIVTCTPSDETFTFGQMDKTVGEIKQAVDAGMEVWFQMTFNQNLTGSYVCNGIDHYPNAPYGYVFVAMFVLSFGEDAYLARLTTSSNSEDSTVWVSTIFPLTPAT